MNSPQKWASRWHGHDLLRQGFTLSQVVHDFGDVCQSITELAMELAAPISAEDFRALNGCLDDAIARAVTEFARERNQATIDGETVLWNEWVGFLTHELRNVINTAILAFEVLKSGKVGVTGSTGKVLYRSLVGARDLIGRSLTEVRLTQGVSKNSRRPQPWRHTPEASRFRVMPVEYGVSIEADRQVLAAVVMNLLQNAFKFSRPRTTVTLRVGAVFIVDLPRFPVPALGPHPGLCET